MILCEVSRTIGAAPHVLFEFLVDVQNMQVWRDEVRSVWLADGATGVVGALYGVVAREPGSDLDLPIPIRLTAAEPDVRIDLELRSGLVTLGSGFRLAPDGEGTELVICRSFDGPLPLTRRLAKGAIEKAVEDGEAIAAVFERAVDR